jgi:hypothetical protein
VRGAHVSGVRQPAQREMQYSLHCHVIRSAVSETCNDLCSAVRSVCLHVQLGWLREQDGKEGARAADAAAAGAQVADLKAELRRQVCCCLMSCFHCLRR